MSNLNLNGFDLVVHLSEAAINEGLQLLPSGTTFPIQQRQNVTLAAAGVPTAAIGGATKTVQLVYDAFLEIERPQVSLDQAGQKVTITCALSPASVLTFLRPVTATDQALLAGVVPQIPVSGSVQLSCPFAVQDISAVWGSMAVSGRSAVAIAAGVKPTINITVPNLDSSGNVLLATSALVNTINITVAPGVIQTAVQSVFGQTTAVGDAIGTLPLTNPVRLNSGTLPPQVVTDVQGRISAQGSPAAISLGVVTQLLAPHNAPTSIPAPPGNLDAAGGLIWTSNYWLLQLVAAMLNAAHPGMTFSFQQDPPAATLTAAVTLPNGDQPITVTKFDITLNPPAGLHIDGHGRASGDCWTTNFDFNFDFGFSCDLTTGIVTPAATQPNVINVNTDKDLLCEIIGAIVGAVVGFIAGAILGFLIGGWCGAVIGGIAGAVIGGFGGWGIADKLIDPLSLNGINLDSVSVLGGVTLPLPVGGAGMVVQQCDFDDLAVGGKIVYVDLAQRYRQGSTHFAVASAFDLDAGIVRTGLAPNATGLADLYWNGAALQAMTGAVFGMIAPGDGGAFGTWSLTQLEDFPYTGHSIPASQIPRSAPVALRMAPGGRVNVGSAIGGTTTVQPHDPFISFSVRTKQGRYAKCRAYRDIVGNLYLEYVVYVSPPLCLGSVITIETISQTVVDSGTYTCSEITYEPPACISQGTVSLLPPMRIGWLDTIAALPSATMHFAAEDLAPAVPAAFETEAGLFSRASTATTSLTGLPPASPSVIGILGGFVRPPIGPILPTTCEPGCGKQITIEETQEEWQDVDRQQQATIEALPSGLAAPLKYRWTVFETDLPAGSGATNVGPIHVTYDENSPVLTLLAPEGQDLVGSIIINATDADGRKVRAIRQINCHSRKRIGGGCCSSEAKLTFADAALQLAKAQAIQRLYQAGIGQMRQIAALGTVQESRTLSVAQAVQEVSRNEAPGGGATGSRSTRGRSSRNR